GQSPTAGDTLHPMDRRTFIHHDGALGDLLLSFPAIAAISAGAGLTHLAARRDAALLLKQAGYVDKESPVDSSFYSSLYAGHPDRGVEKFLGRFERAFIFTTIEDSTVAKNIRRAVPHTRTILTIPPQNLKTHVVHYRLSQLRGSGPCAGIGGGSQRGRCDSPGSLEVPAVYKQRAVESLAGLGWDFAGPLIALHPGSGGRRKCWPFQSYSDLASRIMRQYDPFLMFLSGPAEESNLGLMVSNLVKDLGKRAIHVRNKGLREVSALLSLCDLYVGNDSGISHLAALVNGRVIAVFGPTDPLLWRPVGERVTVVSPDRECAPCGDAESRACNEQRCLSGIPVDRVYDECSTYLESSALLWR
ncbi:MAG TPA: glycosyltransferase family 9 protein, partial [Dissulfurispiraceae bacterium]|nr:glycosyltransferase family 9 protein [Dissulfurispiraceae bacterium]